MNRLQGKKGLVIGVANEKSIAWGCAQAFAEAGAELAITYLNEKAEPYVRPLAEKLGASVIMPLNVHNDVHMTSLFQEIKKKWNTLDFLLHSIAFAPQEDLQGSLTTCSREGFLRAMDTSCYSFVHLAHWAEPLMTQGGSLLTTTYYGSQKVVKNYAVMGPVKAALETCVKYLAAELGPQNIRVNALSPGPIPTRAASGLLDFQALVENSYEKSPKREPITIDAVGSYARFLVSDESRLVTGSTVYIDGGFNILSA